MLRFDIESIEAYKAESVVNSCSELLSLTHCVLFMSIYEGEQLTRNGIDPTGVLIGAMKVAGACSNALDYLTCNGLIEESAAS